MNREIFLRKIVPVGLLFSASLVLSNWVYLRLTVSFIQMYVAKRALAGLELELTLCRTLHKGSKPSRPSLCS
jgi:hypothetical protein